MTGLDQAGHNVVMKGETIEVVEGASQSVSYDDTLMYELHIILDPDCGDQWSSLPNSHTCQSCQWQYQCGQPSPPDCHQCPVHIATRWTFLLLVKIFSICSSIIFFFVGSNSSSTGPVYLSGGASTTTSQQIVSVQNNGTNGTPVRILNN